MKPPQTLFLDAGGVLVNPNWERVADALARQEVVVPASTLEWAEARAKRALDTPDQIRRTTDDSRGWVYFDLVLDHAGVPRSARTDAALAELREYHRRHNIWETVPAEVRPALARLADSGVPMVVVSNANGTLRAHLERLDLAGFFVAILDSHEEGVEKPDPRLFRTALERAGADAATTLHVGDFYEIDVVGARAAGVQAALIDVAGLRPEVDCPRFSSLGALATAVLDGTSEHAVNAGPRAERGRTW